MFHKIILFVSILLLSVSLFAETVSNRNALGFKGEKFDVETDATGKLHMVFKRNADIYYRSGSYEHVVPGCGGSYNSRWYPRLAVEGNGNAHISWSGPPPTSSTRNIYYNSYVNGSWTGRITAISDDEGGADTNRNDITILNNKPLICAQSDYAIECSLFPFTNDVPISKDTNEPKFPSVEGPQLIYNKDTANSGLQGNTWNNGFWGPNFRPFGNGGPCCVNHIGIANDNAGQPHYAWITWSNDVDLFSTLFYGTGSSYKTIVSGSKFFTCPSDECPIPQLAVTDKGRICLVYATGGSNSKVWYCVNSGNGMTAPKRLSQIGNQNYPGTAAHGETVYVVYCDGQGNAYQQDIVFEVVEPTPTHTPEPTATETPTPDITPTATPTPDNGNGGIGCPFHRSAHGSDGTGTGKTNIDEFLLSILFGMAMIWLIFKTFR